MVYGFNQQFNQQQNPYYTQGYNQGYGQPQYGAPQGYNMPQMPQQQGYPTQQQMPQNPYGMPQQGAPNFGVNPGYPAHNNQNFTAVDTEKLKQDAVEISKKSAEHIESNSPLGMVTNMMGIDFKNHPKRTIISLALTLATVVSLAMLGNSKLSTKKIPELGFKVDAILKNNKIYQGIGNFFTNAKTNVVGFLRKSKTIDNVFNTLKNNKAGPKWQIANGQGQGAKRIFKMTPPDVVKTAFDFSDIKDAAGNVVAGARQGSTVQALKKLAGSDAAAEKLYDTIKGGENGEVCKALTEAIKNNFGCTSKSQINTILNQLKEGTIKGLDGSLNIDVSDFTDIVMDSGFSKAKGLGKIGSVVVGTQSAWWPVNGINKVIDLLHLPVKHIGRGNLGDSLIKYNIITGQLADTAVGRAVQKSILLPTECISNFVNDKSGAGVLISLMALPGMFNNVQEAPKEQKIATAADGLISGVGSFTIATPLAFGTTYGLASLANMAKRKDGGGLLAGPLRMIGKFFGMGLDPVIKGVATPKALPFKNAILNAPVVLFRKVKGLGGGAMRFVLISMVLSAFFMGPIKKVVNKIFGKPYNIDEENNKKAQEEAQKALQTQMQAAVAKLEAHPEVLQIIQSDPKALAAIQKDPTILIQLASAIPDTPAQNTPQTFTPSSILQNYMNNPNNMTGPMQPSQPYGPQAPNMQNPYSGQPGMTNPYGQPQQYQPQQQYNPYGQPQAPAQNKIPEPPRSYIPSSRPFNALSGGNGQAAGQAPAGEQITNPNVQAMLAKADKAEQAAMRYL